MPLASARICPRELPTSLMVSDGCTEVVGTDVGIELVGCGVGTPVCGWVHPAIKIAEITIAMKMYKILFLTGSPV
jgi:hypothetical protein